MQAGTDITSCVRCPRLVAHRESIAKNKTRRFTDWSYWGRPVPSFGSIRARVLIVGLAPAAHGANRTGRMFTGDRSGDWLFRALHKAGFANQPGSTDRTDGLKLLDCRITAAAHCAPPDNKVTPEELANCQPYLLDDWRKMKRLRVVICLGQIGFKTYLRARKELGQDVPRPLPKFGHASLATLSDVSVIGSYHPSQQNTFTGRLTEPMLDEVFKLARQFAEPDNRG
jgi:uracil-DNA glycosylase family 4